MISIKMTSLRSFSQKVERAIPSLVRLLMQALADEQCQLVRILNHGWNASASAPVVVEVSVLVAQHLHLIGCEAIGVVDDVVARRRDGSLTNTLTDQEEVIAWEKKEEKS
jgi:hypothetical protein